jgi:hypothetical protein
MFKVLGVTLFFVIFIVASTVLIVQNLSETPVRYRWDSDKKCIVYVGDSIWRPCGSYTKEQLNKFRLEWSEPSGYPVPAE